MARVIRPSAVPRKSEWRTEVVCACGAVVEYDCDDVETTPGSGDDVPPPMQSGPLYHLKCPECGLRHEIERPKWRL